MTLLITLFAAITATILWYANQQARKMKIGTLCLIYWGASIMWLIDVIASYLKSGAAFFTESAEDMMNSTLLGLSVTALGLMIWLVIVLVKDPLGTVHAALMNKRNG